MTTCPKCAYVRKPADTAPAWQCPSCGIAYAKFQAAQEVKAAGLPARDMRPRTFLPSGQRDTPGSSAWFLYGGLGLALFITFTQFRWAGSIKWALPIFVVSSFLYWLSAYRRKRLIEDVPTSTIAAAAQGYVELAGTVAQTSGHALTARLTGAPCAWYQFIIYKMDNENDWVEHDRGFRGAAFMLRDKTGECLVDAGQAEIVCDRCQEWQDTAGNARVKYQEWSIRIGDPVHVIGYFTTGGEAAQAHLNLKAAFAVSAEERDKAAYVERYDTNRDGKVDAQELATARERVRSETMQKHTNQGGTHALGPSPDGRPFLVIGGGQDRAKTHYGLLAFAHLCVFFLSLGGVFYVFFK